MSRDSQPIPPRRHLSPEERARTLRKVEALHDALLFRPEHEALAAEVLRLRMAVCVGALRYEDVPRLAELLERFRIL